MNIKLALAATALAASSLAHSATIDWNTWQSNTSGAIASTPVTVTFAGETNGGIYFNTTSWTPTATFAGGTVGNGPVQANGILRLLGGNTNVDTLTFSQAVVNPVISIWSLGQGGINAQFDFIGATPVLQAGGANAEYGGSGITVSGNNVYGSEGNGTVQFIGTYTSLSWTNPVGENWYGFNVGIAGVAGAVPEPGSVGLLLAGLTLVGLARRRLQK